MTNDKARMMKPSHPTSFVIGFSSFVIPWWVIGGSFGIRHSRGILKELAARGRKDRTSHSLPEFPSDGRHTPRAHQQAQRDLPEGADRGDRAVQRARPLQRRTR